MVIITKGILTRFGLEHPDVAEALNSWYELLNKADWSNLADIKQSFNSVDYVADNRYFSISKETTTD